MHGYLFLRNVITLGVLAASFCMTCSEAVAQDVTAIEEEWQLDIGNPNAARSSPQLNIVTASSGDGLSYHAVLLINQRGMQGGGMELQLWNGPTMIASSDLGSSQSLNTSFERITWTTRMQLSSNGTLSVAVLSGNSTTWGKFSSSNSSILTVSAPTPLKSLNTYDPNFSTNASGIEYGSNRVSKLMLRKVRVYSGNKKAVEQTIDRTVYQGL